MVSVGLFWWEFNVRASDRARRGGRGRHRAGAQELDGPAGLFPRLLTIIGLIQVTVTVIDHGSPWLRRVLREDARSMRQRARVIQAARLTKARMRGTSPRCDVSVHRAARRVRRRARAEWRRKDDTPFADPDRPTPVDIGSVTLDAGRSSGMSWRELRTARQSIALSSTVQSESPAQPPCRRARGPPRARPDLAPMLIRRFSPVPIVSSRSAGIDAVGSSERATARRSSVWRTAQRVAICHARLSHRPGDTGDGAGRKPYPESAADVLIASTVSPRPASRSWRACQQVHLAMSTLTVSSRLFARGVSRGRAVHESLTRDRRADLRGGAGARRDEHT
jgi:hypothetical protein